MGKKGKSLRREKKRLAKRAEKSANRAKYAEWRRTGANSKRNKARAKKKKLNTKSHPQGACTNIGCKRCNPAHLTLTKSVRKVDPKAAALARYKARVGQI
jgi:hypothetical protein